MKKRNRAFSLPIEAGWLTLQFENGIGNKQNWCVRVDSNHRPPPCQGGALTN